MSRLKIFVILLSLLAFSQYAHAQGLLAYSVNGEVEIRTSASSFWRRLTPIQELNLSDSLRFGAKSSVTVLDRSKEKVYALQSTTSGSVASLLNASDKRGNKKRGGLVSYLWNSFRGDNSADNLRNAAGVVYRDNGIEGSLAHAVLAGTNTGQIELRLYDMESGLPIKDEASIGQVAVVNVVNNSRNDFFVNLVDKDASGHYYPCFPAVDAQQLMQLYIPAQSNVLLTSFPIVFGEPRGKEQLILIAAADWFDVELVVNCLNDNTVSTSAATVAVSKLELFVN